MFQNMSQLELMATSFMTFMLFGYIAQAILSFFNTSGWVHQMCYRFVIYHHQKILKRSFNMRMIGYCIGVIIPTLIGWIYLSVILIAMDFISEIFVYFLKRKTLQLAKQSKS